MERIQHIIHTNFDETQQEIVDNIAKQAFLRGKVDALHNLEEWFSEYSSDYISIADLIKAFQKTRLVVAEGLK